MFTIIVALVLGIIFLSIGVIGLNNDSKVDGTWIQTKGIFASMNYSSRPPMPIIRYTNMNEREIEAHCFVNSTERDRLKLKIGDEVSIYYHPISNKVRIIGTSSHESAHYSFITSGIMCCVIAFILFLCR